MTEIFALCFKALITEHAVFVRALGQHITPKYLRLYQLISFQDFVSFHGALQES